MKEDRIFKKPLKFNIYKLNFLEKQYFLNFFKITRLNYYRNPSVNYNNLILFKNKKLGIYNLSYIILTLKKMFMLVMQISFYKGLFVIGGIDKAFINIGKKLFYTFDQWHYGFITNFIKLMKYALINENIKQTQTLLPKRITKLKKILQAPSYNISLKFQYYQLNEAIKLRMPQITAINNTQKININLTQILTINEQNITKNLLIFFLKECLLEVKQKLIKNILKKKKKTISKKYKIMIKKYKNLMYKKYKIMKLNNVILKKRKTKKKQPRFLSKKRFISSMFRYSLRLSSSLINRIKQKKKKKIILVQRRRKVVKSSIIILSRFIKQLTNKLKKKHIKLIKKKFTKRKKHIKLIKNKLIERKKYIKLIKNKLPKRKKHIKIIKDKVIKRKKNISKNNKFKELKKKKIYYNFGKKYKKQQKIKNNNVYTK